MNIVGQEWMHTWRYGFTPGTLGGTCRTLDGVDGRTKLEEGILSPVSYSNFRKSDPASCTEVSVLHHCSGRFYLYGVHARWLGGHSHERSV